MRPMEYNYPNQGFAKNAQSIYVERECFRSACGCKEQTSTHGKTTKGEMEITLCKSGAWLKKSQF